MPPKPKSVLKIMDTGGCVRPPRPHTVAHQYCSSLRTFTYITTDKQQRGARARGT